ncbi:tripartite tricarboxylate transporter TctB family protein [Arthrobacter halodurans]|uniref:Tripartite tricarboxylate transporter TctB family protein n=1 Tax=Arthrobacter halodurans TaxID=516699 RepID=A0ABV4UND6_9MICC
METTQRNPGEVLFALVFVVLGIAGIVLAGSIEVPELETGMGPRAFPYIVSGLLAAVGVGLVLQALRGRHGAAEEGEDVDADASIDWLTIGKLVGFVILHILLIEPAGWPVAATVLFAGAAWTLGAKPFWRSVLIAAGLSLLLQYLFGGLLGVSLPPGPLLEGIDILHG